MDEPCVHIALATYNGAYYLAEQLDSIREQTHSNWRLVLRDDGSDDETDTVAKEYARRDSRITILQDNLGRLGPVASNARLCEECRRRGAQFLFFADQDDRWHTDKVEQQLELMRQLQCEYGAQTPLLIHSDLTVVDPHLKVIAPSLMRFQRIRHEPIQPLRTLLVQNFVTGCSTVINRALLEALRPIPQAAVMHDWWIALVAASLGRIAYLDRPTALYRQHHANCIGATGYWSTLNLWRKSWHIASKNSLREFIATVEQADALRTHLRTRELASSATRGLIEDYCALFGRDHGPTTRVRALLQLGVRRQDWVRQALLLFRLLTTGDLELKTPANAVLQRRFVG